MTFLEKDNSDAVPTVSPGDLGRSISKRHDSDVTVPDVEVFLEILANQARPLSRYYKLLVGCSRGAVTFDHHDMVQEGIHERGDCLIDVAAPRFRELFFAAAPRSKQAGCIQPRPRSTGLFVLTCLEVVGWRQLLKVIKTTSFEKAAKEEFVF